MREPNRRIHYKVLGRRLQLLREKLHESVDEVSGAVEIDTRQLQRIELGELQPSEDVLLLLLTHLQAQDEEALRLWELAGYSQATWPEDDDEPSAQRSIYMVVTPENRVLYTDRHHIESTANGVTVTFTQGNQNVTQLGMSREHAQNLMLTLHQALQPKSPKTLPAPRRVEKE